MLLFKCFSEVMHGSGCHAWYFQGYAWCSLCLCSSRLTTRMGSLEIPPHTHTSGFVFGVNIDYLDFSGGIFDL